MSNFDTFPALLSEYLSKLVDVASGIGQGSQLKPDNNEMFLLNTILILKFHPWFLLDKKKHYKIK